jgi:hypothetical protein
MFKVMRNASRIMIVAILVQLFIPILSASAVELQSPTNLSVTEYSPANVRVTWDEVSGVSKYKVYDLTNGEPTFLTEVGLNRVIFRNLAEGTYTYAVTSVKNDEESSLSSSVSIEIIYPDMQPPKNLNHLIRNGNDITLRWEESNHTTGYHIYQIEAGNRNLVTTTDRLNFTYRDMPEGSYSYEVTSYNDLFGESESASQLAFELIHPEMQAPQGLNHLLRNGNDITLRWNEVEFATAYHVYQWINGERKLVTTTDRLNVTYRDAAEGKYAYEVTSSSDRFGESKEASQLEFELIHPEMQAPEGLNHLIRNGNDITLRWSESEFATGYKVYQVVNDERKLVAKTDRLNVLFRDMPEGTYTYEVTSFSDRFGESTPSDLVFELIHPVMQSPSGLNALIRNGNDILLRWSEAEFATAYKVYQIVDGEYKLLTTTDRLNYNMPNRPEGDYKFAVASYSDRFGESDPALLTVKLEHPEMQPPPGLNALIRNGNDILVRWSEAEFATGYKVYQIVDGEYKLLTTTDRLNYNMPNRPAGEYSFAVTSYSDRFGESQPALLTVNLAHPEMQPPSGLNALIRNGNDILVRWNEAEFATAYKVYQIVDGERKLLTSTDRLNYNMVNNPEGTYTFEVTSYSERFGESKGAQVTATIVYPEVEVPVIQLRSVIDNNASISWRALTGIKEYRVYELVNGEAVQLGTTDRTIFAINDIADGKHDYVVTAVHDRFGESKHSNAVTVEIQNDVTPPETTSNITGEWLNQSFVVELTATDDKSGVDKTFYAINGGQFIEGTTFVITTEGITQVSYYSVDKAGNVEEVNVEEVKVDVTAPETTSNVTDDWFNQDFVVELTAEDNLSGVAQTFYSINGSEYVEGTTFVVTEEGVNQVSFYSVDVAGNVEEANVVEVKIDKTAPVTTSSVTDEWLQKEFTVELTAEDNLSGVAQTFYSINGSEYVEGTTFVVTEEGVNQVSFYSVDVAGNVEEANVVEVKIDKTAPTVSWDMIDEYVLGTELELTYEAEDPLSGIATEELTVNGQVKAKGDIVFFDTPGEYTIQVSITDHAGWTTTLEKTLH